MFLSILLISAIAGLVWVHFFRDVNTVLPPNTDKSSRWVVVTGCDTGFGRLLCCQLAEKKGYQVLAGCLAQTSVKELSVKKTCKEGSLHPFILDVTKDADIAALREMVKSKCPGGLWAVVNNAGLGLGGLVDWTPMKDLRKMFDVNYFGMVAVTDAVLDSIRIAKGRVVNVTSIAGRVSSKNLFGYCGTKFAGEAFSDALRFESRRFGTTVHIIEPGFHSTNIVDVNRTESMVRGYWELLSEERKALWGKEELENILDLAKKAITPADPQAVIDGMIHAITALRPRRRYVIGQDAALFRVIALLPACVSDPLVVGLEKFFLWKARRV